MASVGTGQTLPLFSNQFSPPFFCDCTLPPLGQMANKGFKTVQERVVTASLVKGGFVANDLFECRIGESKNPAFLRITAKRSSESSGTFGMNRAVMHCYRTGVPYFVL